MNTTLPPENRDQSMVIEYSDMANMREKIWGENIRNSASTVNKTCIPNEIINLIEICNWHSN